MRRCRGALPLFVPLLVSLVFSTFAIAAEVPTVTRFSPTGTVKNVRQVTARFSVAMVPLGDPRAAKSPFDVQCSEPGSGRWIDSFTWSYDFNRALPAGVACTFNVRAGLVTMDGRPIEGNRSFSFDTGGPSVVETRPWTQEQQIDEEQAFVLILDAPADEASILDHTSFSVEGIAERVGAKLLSAEDRAVLTKRFARAIDKRPFAIVQAKQTFPNGAKVTLVWGKGIKTLSGIATAQDQTFDFKVRPLFEAKISCERENPKAGCIPFTPIKVNFTADISIDLARRVVLIAPDGARIPPKFDETQAISSVEFLPPFKESTQYTIAIPDHLTDDAGRALANASRFPAPVKVDSFPPLAKFSARFGIIESVDPVLPVTVRNLEPQLTGEKMSVSSRTQGGLVSRIEARLYGISDPDPKTILHWLRRVARTSRAQSVFESGDASGQTAFTMPKPNGAKAFEVMGIPLKSRGLFVVELKSERLGATLLDASKPMYVPTAALVTNLAVHFKQGKANSLVWVTELENANPVDGAEVTIADCTGTQIWTGRTDARGIALVPQLDALDNAPRCQSNDEDRESDYYTGQTEALRDLASGVLITARHRGDFSFVHSSWQTGIESWRFHLPEEYQPSPVIAHTVFDRALFRAGETVHMKHFIRTKTLDGLGVPPVAQMPGSLEIQHVGDMKKYELKLSWNADGTAASDWKIPEDARLGEYDLQMTMQNPSATSATDANGNSTALTLQSGSFHVEQFRVPLMKAAVKLPAEPQVAVSQIPVDISISYLAGGPARGLPIVLRSQINRILYQTFPNFSQFTFANGQVKEGIFKTEEAEEGAEEHGGVHQTRNLSLDAAGGARSDVTGIARADMPQTVRAEVEFRDVNGEVKTAANEVTVWPAGLIAGIRADDWVSSPDRVRAQVAVVDDTGKPAAHAAVNVVALTRKYFTYRKRLVGGFYSYDTTREVKRVGDLCAGTTDDRGLFFCDVKPPVAGEMIMQASVTDAAHNISVANTSVFVPGPKQVWFESHDDDRMDVIAEKPEYQAGDTARFQVRMPFSAATALVTVEREGIIAASVVHLSGKDPVVTVPVRDYAPNAFVSVLAVRGRVAGIMPTATIDLGKPSFRLGIAGIRIGWRGHRLAVSVTPEHPVYHVREKARIKIAVHAPDGGKPKDAVASIAVVDEGLLQLMPNDSWKLLDAMMASRAYQVETSTAEMQVVGRRHFGLKAIPPGGGGGSRVTRELFDTLLLWKPAVPLDADGNATVEFSLNDSLTSFRIVAIASSGMGEFGTGEASIRSTQDLQLFSGVSPIARTGDVFSAQFTVRNASDRPLQVNVAGNVEGITTKPPPTTVALAPGDGTTLSWNITTPRDVSVLKYNVDAVAASGPSDHLRISQQVLPDVPVRTLQATLVQVDKPLSQPVAMPTDAMPGEGGVQVQLSPSLTAGLGSVETWMRNYPYICMEQRVSRAVALHDPNLWKGIVADLPSYLDGDGLLKYFPSMRKGNDVLTSYVLAITNEAGLSLPAEAQASMESGLTDFVEGKLSRRESLPFVDLPMRKLAAIEALSRYGKSSPALVSTITIAPNLWPDSAVIDWWSILMRMPSLPERELRLAGVEGSMRARLNVQGTGMHLSMDPENKLWWLMVSPEETTARLALLLLNTKSWHDDTPRIVRGLMALQQNGAWPSTTANAWGTLAIKKFAAAFESQMVDGETTAALSGASKRLEWSHDPAGGALNFAWPPAQASLDLAHHGSGKPWAMISTSAAVPMKSPFSSGYAITKTIAPVDSFHAGGWKAGDLARVHLSIDAQTDMTWVVIDDPIPAGASQVGVGFANESQIATAGENQNLESCACPSFIERAMSSFRAYYEYVPKGKFEIEYTIRLNQPGTFQLPPTHVQALYEPELLGDLPNAPFVVLPQ